MTDAVEVREARPDDLPEMLGVLRAALGESPLLLRTPDLFAWKHHANPFGRSIVLVATVGDRLAGVRAFMRWELATPDGDRLRCVRPVDTATHPDFERRGIFRSLTLHALEEARADGVDLVFNTPNPRSGAGYLSMGWQEVGWVDVLVRPRLTRRTRSPADSLPTLGTGMPGVEPFVHPSITDRDPLGLRTPRSPTYLAWRFAGHPTARYGWLPSATGSGGAVARVGLRGGHPETVLSDLLGDAGPREVRAVIRASRTHHVAGFFSRRRPERRHAMAGGMVPAPWMRTLRLVALPLTGLATNALDLGSWDLATSDLELL
jgi:GNAT superfamily N-acetyltransferase